MNLKKIIVYQDNVLFSILNEIKENFNFEVLKANKKELDNYINAYQNDFILVSKFKVGNFQNQLTLNNKPIKIDKLIEQINLKFLKEKFNFQSDFSVGSYKLNLNSREMIKDKKSIDLTEREINLIIFLKKISKPVKIDKIQKEVWEYGADLETHTVETHIYRLRKKIKEKFNDENFIVSSKKGYSLN
tara:strand:+ start:1135 stop:1698 length:564 start_codon:yes stop_codon:yes gene_type:complete